MNTPKFISFFNQKGGVGKSTLCSMYASFLYHNTKESVCVIDADNLQRSLITRRNEEISDLNNIASFQIKAVNSEDFVRDVWEKEQKQANFNYIIVDFPGNLWQKGVVQSLCLMDLIIVPTGFSDIELNALDQFTSLFNEHIKVGRYEFDKSLSPTKLVYAFNRINKRHKEAKTYLKEGSEDFLKTVIPDSVCFQRGFTTVNEYEHYKDKKLVKKFCKEIMKISKNL